MTSSPPDRIYASDDPAQVARDLEPLLDFQPRGVALEDLSKLIDECLVPHFVDYGHPGFHSLYDFYLETGADLGAGVALKYNQGVTNWQVSPGAVMFEEMCGKALCRLFRLPTTAEATFMYSGTYANQQAVYLALHRQAEKQGFDAATGSGDLLCAAGAGGVSRRASRCAAEFSLR